MVLVRRALWLLLALLLAGCQVMAVIQPVIPSPTPHAVTSPLPTRTPAPTQFLPTSPPTRAPTYPPTSTRAPTGTPYPTPTATPVVLGVMGYPPDINPLTGLKVADPTILNRRPVMVKISNYPRYGRPHAGLSFADLVFEYYIGEYASRFSAIYFSQDTPKAGPLRSGRLVDADLAMQYGAVLVYGNADPRVDKVLVDTLGPLAVTFDDAPCPPICGKDTHSEAGVFVDTTAMNAYMQAEGIDNTRPTLGGMVFDARLPTGKPPAVQLGVMFGPQDRGEWRYDPASGSYLRWIEEIRAGDQTVMIPLVDRVTGKQLAFSNVVILYATYIEHLPTLHDILITENETGNRAVYFRDGVIQEGLWKVRTPGQPIQLFNSYSAPIALKPGPTWLIIVGQSSDLFSPKDGFWELEYHTQ